MALSAPTYTEFANRIGRGVGSVAGAPGRAVGQLTVTTTNGTADPLAAVVGVANGLPANAIVTRLQMGPGPIPTAGGVAHIPVLDAVNQAIRYINGTTGALIAAGGQATQAGMILNIEWCIP